MSERGDLAPVGEPAMEITSEGSPAAGRRSYGPPTLAIYGTLSDLTRARGTDGRDGLIGSRITT